MKDRWDLVPWTVLEDMVKVLTFGAEKHSDYGWQDIPDPYEFHFQALMRHITDWRKGHVLDEESKLPHLAHAMCRLMFLSYFDMSDHIKPSEPLDEQSHILLKRMNQQLHPTSDQD